MKRISMGDKLVKIIIYMILVLFAVAIVLPFLNIIAVSLSSADAVRLGKVGLWPIGPNVESYKKFLEDNSFLRAYGNTVYICVLGTSMSVILVIMAGYVTSRRDMPGVKVINFMITLTMWFSGGMIPSYLVVKSVGLYDSLGAIFIPYLISAFNVILMKSFILQIPAGIEESARLDGCNDIQLLFRILVPMSKASIATIALFVLVGYWNSYMPGVLYIQSEEKFPLQLLVREVVFNNTMTDAAANDGTMEVVSQSVKSAAIIISALPVMIIYPFLQKYFVKGATLGAVKG